MRPFQFLAFLIKSSTSNIPSFECAITPLSMPLSRMKDVSARVSIPDKPIIPRFSSHISRSLLDLQLDALVIEALNIAPLAALFPEILDASSSSSLVPVLPICGKVKHTT